MTAPHETRKVIPGPNRNIPTMTITLDFDIFE
jgi:hypothetical protein